MPLKDSVKGYGYGYGYRYGYGYGYEYGGYIDDEEENLEIKEGKSTGNLFSLNFMKNIFRDIFNSFKK